MNIRFMQAIASLGAVFLTAAASAADRMWDGGSLVDSNWSTATNWDADASAPVAGDALFFGGSARLTNTNDFDAGTSFAGLTFNNGAGAFTLNGNGIVLGGTLTNASANTQTLNLPLTLDATRVVASSGGAITLNGMLSGAGGWTKGGSAQVTLSASNSYDGATLINTGVVTITHGWALGSTNGSTTVSTLGRARLEIGGGITVAEPLVFTGNNNERNGFINTSGSNTLCGLMTTAGARYVVNGGTALVLAGGMTGNPFFVLNGSGTLYVRTTPLAMGTGNFYADDTSLTVFETASNVWGELTIAKGTVRTDVKDALSPAATVRMGLPYGPAGKLDLNGFDQTTTRVYTQATNAAARLVTSATPATLTINQSLASSWFDGSFTGAVSLVKTGTGTMHLTNAVSPTTGGFTVSNGTLVISSTARLPGSTNLVVAGGTLEIRSVDALSDKATLSVGGSGKVYLGPGLTEMIDRLVLGGVPQHSGFWGATGSGAEYINDTYLSGTGLLWVVSSPEIVPAEAKWDADGGVSDLLLSTPANWSGDSTPAFGGSTRATFATAGATATVDVVAGLYGISFNRDGNFTLAAGAGVISNGAGGVSAALPSATSRSYAIAEDIVLTDSQTWSLAKNGAGQPTLTVSGAISDGLCPYNLTQSGDGVLVLSGNNTFDGLTTVKTNSVLKITHGSALGSTVRGTVVENGGWLEVSGGVTVAEPITISGEAALNYAGVIRNTGGSNTWSGLITSGTNIGSRIRVYGGSLDIVGGVTGAVGGYFVIGADGGTYLRFSEKPITLGGSSMTSHTGGGAIILAVTNNTWNQLEAGGSYMRFDLPNVLPPASTLMQGSGSSKSSLVNMNGNSQTIGQLKTGYAGPEQRIIFSAAPATLTVNQSGNSEYNGSLTGAVSLVKTGTGTLTLSGTNALFGAVAVSNGTLLVNGTGTLGENTPAIVVGGTGTLILSNSAVIADSATVTLPPQGIATAKISLAEGVNDAVRYLYFGAKQQRAGTYGSLVSPAVNKDGEHFAGQGVLTVLRDDFGTVIKLH